MAPEAADLDGMLKTMSGEELTKLEKLFKNKEHVELLMDYMKDLQDPQTRAELDEYLRQAEAEGRAEELYGKGVQLITPEAAFVLRFTEAGTAAKVFVNLCTSAKVDPVQETPSSDAARPGTSVSIPLSLGPMRPAKTKRQQGCRVWDLVVNPGAVERAGASPAFRNVLVDSARDRIQEVAGIKLDHTFRVLKATKYFASDGEAGPRVLSLRANQTARDQGSAAKAATTASPAPRAADSGMAGKAAGASSLNQAFLVKQGGKSRDQAPAKPLEPSQAGFVHPTGEVTPTWELVHRGTLDLASAWGDAGKNLQVDASHPKELVVRVQLPGLSSAKSCQLDVGPRRIQLLVPGRYALDVPLPYTVLEVKGRASFDKPRQQLTLTLPVKAPPPAAAAAAAGAVALVREVGASDAAASAAAAAAAAAASAGAGRGEEAEFEAAVQSAEAVPAGAAVACGEHEHAAAAATAEAPSPDTSAVDNAGGEGSSKSTNQLAWERLHASCTVEAVASGAMDTAEPARLQQPSGSSSSGHGGTSLEQKLSGHVVSGEQCAMQAAAPAAVDAAAATAAAAAAAAAAAEAAAAAAVPATAMLPPRLMSSLALDID